MSKKEFLQEKMQLMNKENEVVSPKSFTNTNDVLELQAEIEQAEILLQGFVSKSNTLDTKISESMNSKAQAQEELNIVKQKNVSSSSSTRARNEDSASTASDSRSTVEQHSVCKADLSQAPSDVNNTNTTTTEIQRFQTQKAK